VLLPHWARASHGAIKPEIILKITLSGQPITFFPGPDLEVIVRQLNIPEKKVW
jgi:hypothetical protein